MKHNMTTIKGIAITTGSKKQLRAEDAFLVGIREDTYTASHKSNRMLQEKHDNEIYRVDTQNPNSIEVLCFGIDKLDGGVEGVYDNINEIPEWMQERLSLLSMLSPKSTGETDIHGVGRRISQYIYWVYAE